MIQWILMPVRNGLHFTQRALRSFRDQDIEHVKVLAIDNDSRDGTLEYLRSQHPFVAVLVRRPALSVAASWNRGLSMLFNAQAPRVLVVNNDVELMPQTYRLLYEYSVESRCGFVTAVGVGDHSQLCLNPDNYPAPNPHPDLSCFLITEEVWRKVGPFDERFEGAYCEDLDYHIRMHQAGVEAVSINVPFLHFRSGTIKSATSEEAEEIGRKANHNRELFREKWGVEACSPEYDALFSGTQTAKV